MCLKSLEGNSLKGLKGDVERLPWGVYKVIIVWEIKIK